MNIAIAGAGPAGLYFAALMKQLDPTHEITVWERNAHDDTFGFGVVFSDETLGGIENADREFYRRFEQQCARWTDIDVTFRGETTTIGGQGFAAAGRKELLLLLQQRCADLGVVVHFRTEAPPIEDLMRDYELVLAADGLNSVVRRSLGDVFGTTLDLRPAKYIWLALPRAFEAFTFWVKQTEHGIVRMHGYPYSADMSTFIVEMEEDTWRAHGFDATEDQVFPPGHSDEHAVAGISAMFATELCGDALRTNNSKWLNFTTVRNDRWSYKNVVLIGDAAHTAHFSIGSGTKLAMEDALALAANLHEHPTLNQALAAYEHERRPVVFSLQRAAQASLEWFENIGQYAAQTPLEFTFNLLTRSRRITLENLALRDPSIAARIQARFAGIGDSGTPPMLQPYRMRDLELRNRIVVSPMDQYSAVQGTVGDYHLVHLGSRAIGGAGLVMTEMIAPSATGRITPGGGGLYEDAHVEAWGRIVDFAHTYTNAKIGAQIGHSGRKGSTKLMWEGMDDPLEDGGWEPIGPSAIPYGPGSRVPHAASRSELAEIRDQFVAATRRADAAGFDLLELHAAHGYLLSSFLSPLSNLRDDEYGGSIEARLRYPLEVFDAMRAVWPAQKPMMVRISACDWAPGGNTDEDAVVIARAFIEHGVDAIDVSSGQVVKNEQPAFGRSYQTPFADKIRNRVAQSAGVGVVTVGAISSADDANSLLLAGRADLIALGRTHLWDPYWTLHAAADLGYRGPGAEWIEPYRAGSRKPPTARTDAVRPRLELLTQSDSTPLSVHRRWVDGKFSSHSV